MKRFGPALLLAVLSAVTAEFLLGDQWLTGFMPAGQQVVEFVLYVMFYGGAANLIRHAARRYRRGWPSILLYALAFGVFEEGMVDQSLFNPDFAGLQLIDYGHVPGLGISAPWTVFVLSLHVIWSIAAPIAVSEAWFAHVRDEQGRGDEPPASWLGPAGVMGWAGAFIVSSAALLVFTAGATGFMATPVQLGVSAGAAVGAAVAAARRPPVTPTPGSRPWISAATSLVLLSAYYSVFEAREQTSPWLCLAAMVVLLAVLAATIVGFRLDPFGLATGALATYAWVGLRTAVAAGGGAIVEQLLIIAVVAAVLLVVVRIRARARRRPALRHRRDAREHT